MYVTGFVKLFAVVPLVCVVAPTATEAPVVVNEATRAVTSVPFGTVTAMLVPEITPVPSGKLKTVIALVELKSAAKFAVTVMSPVTAVSVRGLVVDASLQFTKW